MTILNTGSVERAQIRMAIQVALHQLYELMEGKPLPDRLRELMRRIDRDDEKRVTEQRVAPGRVLSLPST